MKATRAQLVAAWYVQDPLAEGDARALWHWNRGVLSPRQSAGFYEVTPARYPAVLAAYRVGVKRIEKAAAWRRKHPAPIASHVGVGWGHLGSFGSLRAGKLSEAWFEYNGACRRWGELTKAKKAKTPEPTPPKGDAELLHDASWGYYGKNSAGECPGCAGFGVEKARWQQARIAAYTALGFDPDKLNRSYIGTEPARWPDGSFDGDYTYPPLPIRSARTVLRTPPIE